MSCENPLTFEDATKITELTYKRDVHALADEFARLDMPPPLVIGYYARLSGTLLRMLHTPGESEFWAIENHGDEPIPVYIQMVSAAANDDGDTMWALVNTLDDADAMMDALVQLIDVSAGMLHMVSEQSKGNKE